MNFIEALDALIVGKKIRRNNWFPTVYLAKGLREHTPYIVRRPELLEERPFTDIYEIISNDWEIYRP